MKNNPFSNRKKRLLLVDDHHVVRDGIALWLGQTSDLEVCATADHTIDALNAIEQLHPDLVVTDIRMAGRDGLELTKDIKTRWPKLPVLVFSVNDDSLYAARALRAGAFGYCNKNSGPEALLTAIRSVLSGQLAFSTDTITRLLEENSAQPEPGAGKLAALSDREFEVFRLFGEGKTNQEVAAVLHLSPKTVESHSLSIRKKLNLRTPSELIRHAVHFCAADIDKPARM